MTGTQSIVWQVLPAHPPHPHHSCARCACTRPFRPSGKVRLNANGQRLDAWLIYKCTTCDATWNLPLLDRVPVRAVSKEVLQALSHSDPSWVAARSSDLALLRCHAHQIDLATDCRVSGPPIQPGWTNLCIALTAPAPVGDRLDRLIARALKLPRSDVVAMARRGGLIVRDGILNRPVRDGTQLQFVAECLAPNQRQAVTDAPR